MSKSLALQNLMSQYNLKLFFSEPTTLYQAHINHIWTNANTQQSHFDTTKEYWTSHKGKLSHFIPKFVPL